MVKSAEYTDKNGAIIRIFECESEALLERAAEIYAEAMGEKQDVCDIPS